MFNNFFFSSENRAVYELMSKNVVEPERPQVAIWRMRVECWISKATRAQVHASARARTHTHAGVLFHGNSVALYAHCLSCYVRNGIRIPVTCVNIILFKSIRM